MGLDTVDLVIRFEEAFGIAIPDEVAATLTTPRQVRFYVMSQLARGEQSSCMSQQAFYLLRREFLPVLGIRRSDFRPASNLSQIIPIERRNEVWTTIGTRIGISALPDLARPMWLFSLLLAATIISAVGITYYARAVTGSYLNAFIAGVLGAIVFGYFAELLTRPLKRHFRYRYQYAGQLAKYVVSRSPHSFKREWTNEEVASVVRQIIIDETGITDFTEDSRFIEDMHLD